MSAEFEQVFAAWRLSPDMHRFGPPASPETIAGAERALGKPVPEDLKEIYRFSNGMEPLNGNLTVEPLAGGDGGGLVGLSEQLRGWGWPIPRELLVFGSNGAGDQFGLWYPDGTPPSWSSPVVMVGEVFEPASLALVGTTFSRFLRAWSAYYLIQGDGPTAALDALGLPETLRSTSEDAGLAPYFGWADPTLPDPDPNPYQRGMTTSEIATLVEDVRT